MKMLLRKEHAALIGIFALAGCSFSPRPQAALPQVRDVPVLAGLGPAEALARGRAFLASKQYGLAIELFKSSSRDPALAADSFNGLAVAYDGIGRSDLAERYFERALAARPDDARTRRNLATFYAKSGQEAKRGQLLAGAVAPRGGDAGAAKLPQVDAKKFDVVATSFSPADYAGASALQARSPLGGTFRPLLAGKIVPNSVAAAAPVGDISIRCEHRDGESGGDGAMTILRISMGEVFISAQPMGANCVIEGDPMTTAATLSDRPLSNKEYLGLVASYLEQLDALRATTDISIAWKAAFWSWHDRA